MYTGMLWLTSGCAASATWPAYMYANTPPFSTSAQSPLTACRLTFMPHGTGSEGADVLGDWKMRESVVMTADLTSAMAVAVHSSISARIAMRSAPFPNFEAWLCFIADVLSVTQLLHIM